MEEEESFAVNLPALGLTVLIIGAVIMLGANALAATGIINLTNQPLWVLAILALVAVVAIIAAISFIYPVYLRIEEKINGKKPEKKPSKGYTINQIKEVK